MAPPPRQFRDAFFLLCLWSVHAHAHKKIKFRNFAAKSPPLGRRSGTAPLSFLGPPAFGVRLMVGRIERRHPNHFHQPPPRNQPHNKSHHSLVTTPTIPCHLQL